MDLLPSGEQEAIAGAARDVLADLGYPARANDLAAEGVITDDKLWSMAVELGWLGLGVPEEGGGAGYGLPEQVMLARELGRALAVGPFLSGMVAGVIVEGDVRDRVLAGATVGWVLGATDPTAVRVCNGPTTFALWPADELDLVELSAPGVPVVGIDPTVGLATVEQVQSEVLAEGGAAGRRIAEVLVAAGLVGIAEAVRDQAVAHAIGREQFGRPIGSFQAIKHLCADLAVAAEAAWRQVCWAALSVAAEDADRQVRSARIVAQHAALDGAAANIQVHGAMGFTAEHTAHLYLKRARTWSQLAPVRPGALT